MRYIRNLKPKLREPSTFVGFDVRSVNTASDVKAQPAGTFRQQNPSLRKVVDDAFPKTTVNDFAVIAARVEAASVEVAWRLRRRRRRSQIGHFPHEFPLYRAQATAIVAANESSLPCMKISTKAYSLRHSSL